VAHQLESLLAYCLYVLEEEAHSNDLRSNRGRAALLILVSRHSKSRFFYRRSDLDAETFLLWLDRRGSFNQELEKARRNNEQWTKEPQGIALHLAGYPNLDGTKPDNDRPRKHVERQAPEPFAAGE
jgi:hypothetical protein